jgi:tetratricopeptide (TPR) repeat protein
MPPIVQRVQKKSRTAELLVGEEVVLQGVASPAYNGKKATIIALADGQGRHRVSMVEGGAEIVMPRNNLRRNDGSTENELAGDAAIVGVTLKELGLECEDGASSTEEEELAQQQLLLAMTRAVQRDTCSITSITRSGSVGSGRGAYRAAELSCEKLMQALKDKNDLRRMGGSEEAVPETEDAASDSEGDGDGDGTKPLSKPLSDQSPQGSPSIAPHMVSEAGHLGERVQQAALLAASESSTEDAKKGATMLRQILRDEQRRVRWAADGAGAEETAGEELLFKPAEGADALRLRLTLVRTLLRCRLDAEALTEATAATTEHADTSAAWLWHGRCMLRAGRREEGMKSIARASDLGPSAGADGAWAHQQAVSRLRSVRKADRCRMKADDAYSRGLFKDGAELYEEAIAISKANVADDKWGRALLYANKAACLRRARVTKDAIAACDAALALFPRFARALFRKAACLLEGNRPREAVKVFETLLRVDRKWPSLCEWLVRSHAHERRAEKQWGKGGRPDSDEESDEKDGKDEHDEKGPLPGFSGGVNMHGKGHVDHYLALGVTSDATEAQLKRAYRMMSLKFHPDRAGGSTVAFQRVAAAYETLSDAERRTAYDEGTDVKKTKDDSDDDGEHEEQSLREEIERKYFPERYKFHPFGDPWIEKRKLQAKRRKRAGRTPFDNYYD